MHLFHVLGVVLSFILLTACEKTCDPGWVNRDGESCYLLTEEHGDGPDFWSASNICKDKESHLAVVTTKKENDFIKSWLRAEINDETEGVWLDGQDPRSHDDWRWTTFNIGFNFSDFAQVNTGQTFGSRCLSMSPQQNFSWVSEDCMKESNMKLICEKDNCELPTQCFAGSCYTLFCSREAPWSYKYMPDFGFGKPSICPRGNRARIDSEEKNNFIKTYLAQAQDFITFVWTDGFDEDKNGEWIWQEHEEPITGFTNWNTKRYDSMFDHDACMALSRDHNWAWTSMGCSEKHPILCEEPDFSG